MLQTVHRLWGEDAGFVVSSELVLIATIMVIGLLAGLATVRDQVVQELADVAAAVSNMNQSYSWSGVTAHHASVSGSLFDDNLDDCDQDVDPSGSAPHCIVLTITATAGEGG